jgi:small subunit ribosomal protein S17
MPKRILSGKVVSTKMNKTGVVQVERRPMHKLYKKVQARRKKFKFHDENEVCGEGDIVRVIECRPLSKDKHYRLLDVVEKAVK